MTGKIVFITHSAQFGGGEFSLLDIAKTYRETCRVLFLAEGPIVGKFRDEGLECEVLPLPNSVRNIAKGSLAKNLFVLALYLPFITLKLALKIRSADLVFTNSQKAHFLLFLPCKLLRKKWVVYYQDFFSKKFFGRFEFWLTRVFLNRGPSLIIANSETTKRALESAEIKTRIEIVYNFILFPGNTLPTSAETLKSLASPILFCPSRFSYWKGQVELLRAAKHLKHACEIVLIKEAFFNETIVADLDTVISELPPTIKLRLLGLQKSMDKLYSECHLVVHTPNRPEPFGRVIIEAIGHCRPVFVSDYATVDGLIIDKVTGFVATNLEEQALAKKLDEAIDCLPISQPIVQNAYKAAKNLCSFERTLGKIHQLIQEIIDY